MRLLRAALSVFADQKDHGVQYSDSAYYGHGKLDRSLGEEDEQNADGECDGWEDITDSARSGELKLYERECRRRGNVETEYDRKKADSSYRIEEKYQRGNGNGKLRAESDNGKRRECAPCENGYCVPELRDKHCRRDNAKDRARDGGGEGDQRHSCGK